jgi:HSP90 family molecular chaperone
MEYEEAIKNGINAMSDKKFEVDLTPDISSLKMFKSLSFTPWFALGEFIDNSITSAIKNHEKLISRNGRDFVLQIRINFDKEAGTLVVSDNAAGISERELRERALRTGIPPEDTSIGLGKHGVLV